MKFSSSTRRRLPGLVALTLATAASALAQKDDFDDGNDIGWTRYNPIGTVCGCPIATYSFPGGNTYRIQSAVNNINPAFGPSRAGSIRTDATYSDFYVSADIVAWNNTADQAIGLLARLDDVGPGTTDGYAMTYQVTDNTIAITAFENEIPGADVGSGASALVMVPGQSYRFVFIGQSNLLTAMVFQHPDLENPVANISGNNFSYSSGTCGLLAYDNSGGSGGTDVTFDNYLALSAPPPRLAIELTVFQDVWITWPMTATGFILQSSPGIQPTRWTDIDPPYAVSGDQFIHFVSVFENPSLYYRLIKR